ncbi:MAG: AAA family ATPase [Pyrinomonadaceae bacterium]
MDELPARYETAAGWEPKDTFKRLREKARREMEAEDRLSEPILRSADDASEPVRFAGGEELFANLWQTGEVALFYGEPGVGKSIFAARLAEAIAKGVRITELEESSPLPERRVVYIDFQRNESQANRLNGDSLTKDLPGGRHASPSYKRLHFDWSAVNAGETDGIRATRVQASIFGAFESGAEVVILDDILLGGINIGRPQGPLRTLRTLKSFAADSGTSVLVIASARARKRMRPASLSDIAFRHIAEIADSVFCLSASTYGPAFRYVRHLRSCSAPIIHDASAVLSFMICPARNDLSQPASLPVVQEAGGIISTEPDPDSSYGIISTEDAPAIASLTGPPQFNFLGTTEESVHLRDYAAEASKREHRERTDLRRFRSRSARSAMIDGLMDGSYAKYLKGK